MLGFALISSDSLLVHIFKVFSGMLSMSITMTKSRNIFPISSQLSKFFEECWLQSRLKRIDTHKQLHFEMDGKAIEKF